MCSLKSNEPGAGIVLMKLDELHSFAGHPFKVERNQELFELRNLGVFGEKTVNVLKVNLMLDGIL